MALELPRELRAAWAAVRSLAQTSPELVPTTRDHVPHDHLALRKGEDVPKALRVRYALTRHLNLGVPKFKSAETESVFCRAAGAIGAVTDTTTLPGVERALFRVEAKRYGNDRLERVLAVARPTA